MIMASSSAAGLRSTFDGIVDANRALTIAPLTALLLSACAGAQSSLAPAAPGAADIANLFWAMTIGSAFILLAVLALLLYGTYGPAQRSEKLSKLLVVGGGAVFPTVVLTGLLIYGLAMLPDFVAPAPAGSMKISVTGEQWWWRVRYHRPGAPAIELANEIRLPVNEAVQFELDSPDVIHSFWIPSLGGKVDMIPGRHTHLALTPTKIGEYRGVCAEYCGTSHAWMAFPVVVSSRPEFTRWLTQQAKPAVTSNDSRASLGRELFVGNGCGACHTVRGSQARGVIGPDLTHVGGRMSLGAGTLPNDIEAFRRWIAHTNALKPDVLMPEFHMLKDGELSALAAYLESLQ
jgi:cytochrome c oxidase subunit 2